MTSVKLRSCLADQIQRFIDLRRLSGTDYSSPARLLGYFDAFLVKYGCDEPRITREVIDRYHEEIQRLSLGSRKNRIGVVRQFCEYLSKTDSHTYVPEPGRRIRSDGAFRPYVFTLSQIRDLMAAASNLQPSGPLHPETCRTLIGLLYSTGIRIGEALALNLGSFCDAGERLYIAQGKFRKARWVPLSSSTCRAVQKYLEWRLLHAPRMQDSPLFLNRRRCRLKYATVSDAFGRLLKQCSIAYDKTRGPRLHSFRHSFAVYRLLAWYRDGKNINERLPFLATYMGHVNIGSTRVYLRPTAELLGEVSERFRQHYLHHVEPQGGNL